MLKTYPAIFHEEKDKSYWIEFPEFNGGTQGDNLEEAMLMAKDFLAGILAYYIEEDTPLPEPTDISTLKVDDGFTTLIQVDPSAYIKGNKTIRKNVTIPEWISIKADKENINYSETLTRALTKRLNLE